MWLLPPELTERVFCILLVDRTNEAVDGATLARECLLPLPLVCRAFAASFRSSVLWGYVLQRCFFLPPESTAAAMRRTSEFARQACARASSSTCLTWGDWASRGNDKGGAVQVVHGGPLALLRSSSSSFVGQMAHGGVSIIEVDVLGKGEYNAASVAVAVPHGRVVQIAQTASTCVLVNEHGNVYESPLGAWSREWCTETQADPCTVMERIPLASDTYISAVACGDDHILALSAATGKCFGWGDNRVGQLGEATASYWSGPRMVTVPTDQGTPCHLAAGHQFSVICTTLVRILPRQYIAVETKHIATQHERCILTSRVVKRRSNLTKTA